MPAEVADSECFKIDDDFFLLKVCSFDAWLLLHVSLTFELRMVMLMVESLLFLVDSEVAEDWHVFLSKLSMGANTRDRLSAAVIDLACSSNCA